MCPLKKPLIFAHEVELIEIDYFISMLTYTGFGPKCVYKSRLLFWFNHAKQIVVTYNCNIHAFKIISMDCTTTKYMIHSLHTLSPCICIGRTLILYYYGLHNNWVSPQCNIWILLESFSLDYVTLFMDGAYGTRFVQFTHFFTNHYVHHARTSCKYIHVPTYLVLFHSLVQQ